MDCGTRFLDALRPLLHERSPPLPVAAMTGWHLATIITYVPLPIEGIAFLVQAHRRSGKQLHAHHRRPDTPTATEMGRPSAVKVRSGRVMRASFLYPAESDLGRGWRSATGRGTPSQHHVGANQVHPGLRAAVD